MIFGIRWIESIKTFMLTVIIGQICNKISFVGVKGLSKSWIGD